MKALRPAALTVWFVGAVFVSIPASAQVPPLVNYQGRVAVGGVNFHGTGQFKFALVDGAGSTTFWSNDGSSSAGSQPTGAVPLAVANGLYSVLLGDVSLANMTALPASVFTNSDVRLRVWFDDGTNGSQQLAPDQRIAAVGYAVVGANMPDGAITSAKLAAGAVGSAQLAPGAVGSAQLAAGAVAANLAASGQSGVPSGGLVLSTEPRDARLLLSGFVLQSQFVLRAVWERHSGGTPPDLRGGHTAVWTGSEMIVWGGTNSSAVLNSGGRYNPATNLWTPVATLGAPAARFAHTAVWTGSEMIVWGGSTSFSIILNDGGRYLPATDTWAAVQPLGAPSARWHHSAVWTGSEMIVWGGYGDVTVTAPVNDGGRYRPSGNTWAPVSTTGAPSARGQHTAVWTGGLMLVWGGSTETNSGGRYNAGSNTWSPMNAAGAPAGRREHTAVWTGSEMIVWGGFNDTDLGDGGRYQPASNTWTPVSSAGAPAERRDHTAVWTGREMILWGGVGNDPGPDHLRTGGSYRPATDSWVSVTTTGAPAARFAHTAVWTGTEMLVWGGFSLTPQAYDPGNRFVHTYSYTPLHVFFTFQQP